MKKTLLTLTDTQKQQNSKIQLQAHVSTEEGYYLCLHQKVGSLLGAGGVGAVVSLLLSHTFPTHFKIK